MNPTCPAILIAAPASGQGKTTVSAALARLQVRRGRRVRAFKCGPDFLDPLWLGLATGAPVHNLDLWMTGEADIRARLHAAALEADLIAAFSFIYPANLDALRSLGAELVFFSPLVNEPLPACDAVWLPGGYPELHAAVLARSEASCDSLRAHVQAGLPVWAECGGMVVLFDELIDREGQAHTGWGLLPGRVRMGERLAALGPHQLGLAAGTLRGHSFHYSRCETELAPALHTESVRGGVTKTGEALYQRGALRASYFHAWFASNPRCHSGFV